MYNEWSLDVLYKGADDPALQEDFNKLKKAVTAYKTAVAFTHIDAPAISIRDVIEKKEVLSVIMRRLMSYFSLRRSVNATDTECAELATKTMALISGCAGEDAAFKKFLGSIINIDPVIESDELLKEYRFYLEEAITSSYHTLTEQAESVFSKLNISGGKAWSDMVSFLTAGVEVEYKGEKTTLSTVRGLAESANPKERKEAYEAELACYDKIRHPIAFALNSIKEQVNAEAGLRGYDDALEMTLARSRMNKMTLDAMLDAMKEYLPVFHKYLRHKAKLLGYENGLPWYELFAPMGKASSATFTAEEAHKYLVEHFESFAPDLAEMADRAFKENWIDFYPKAGKVGGAFCSNLSFVKQSRILTNFSGSFGSVVTLAHELGHAYHGQLIEDHRVLNTSYTMPVAETASNFNELIIVNDAIAKSEGEERIRLIESQIQDCTQIIVDIYSRFLFEDEVFRRRKGKFMFADELEQIMIDAQKQAYGDGLDHNFLHPYMWCCKSHYYSSGLSYYNFPYAFGGLFSRGLYAKYLEEKEEFLPKYRALLHATTVNSVEKVAGVAGIDLTKPDFWKKSLQVIADQIDLFISETSEK